MSQEKTLTLRQQIEKMAGDGEELKPLDFENLILDDIQINELTADDAAYLETFSTLGKLCLNHTGLKNLNNLPAKIPIFKLELSDNKISGDELSKLAIYEKLTVLKIYNNKIETLDQVKSLAVLKDLVQLDLSENPVCKVEDYRKKVYELLPELQILDGHDRDDQSFFSDEYGEEGEDDLDDMVLKNLDPETKKKFKNGEIGIDELREMGLTEDDLSDYDEEGEFEMEEGGESEKDEGANKKQKT